MVEHCMTDYSQTEQLMTCVHCGKPLSDNQRVKELYTAHTTMCWAKQQLRIIADMLEGRGENYFAGELRRIGEGMKGID